MILRRVPSILDRIVTDHPDRVALAALALALVLIALDAATTYLNPDEAHYFQMSVPNGLRELYQSALGTHHPALYIMLMHWLSKLSEHELALRSVAVVAGALFPWFLYRWLSLVWTPLAGLLALLLTAFAPHVVTLSAEARGYTLAFMGIFACLYFQERAWRESSSRWMMLSSAALCVAIFAEYFVAFFAGAAGLCFLLRAWTQRPSNRLWVTWAAGQACAIALYGFLFVTQIQPIMASPMGQTEQEPWLHDTFPDGRNLAYFLASSTLKQFAWLFASPSYGRLMVIPFLAGLWILWKGRSGVADRLPARLLIVLTALMFALAGLASVAHVHPFGRTRHTGILGIFAVATIAVALEQWVRRSPGVILPAALLLIPAWHLVAVEGSNIARARHQRAHMVAGVDRLRTSIPAGSTILVDQETRWMLDYYLGRGTLDRPPRQTEEPRELVSGGYRLVMYRFHYLSADALAEDVRRFRADYRVPPDADVWFVDGGWLLWERSASEQKQFHEENFGNVLSVMRLSPEFATSKNP